MFRASAGESQNLEVTRPLGLNCGRAPSRTHSAGEGSCWLGLPLGTSAQTPTCDFCMWSGLPHGTVAEAQECVSQENQAEAVLPFAVQLRKQVVSLPPLSEQPDSRGGSIDPTSPWEKYMWDGGVSWPFWKILCHAR